MALVERASESRLEQQPVQRRVVHRCVVEVVLAAAVLLREVQRRVGVPDQRLDVAAVGREHADADASADHDLVAVEVEGLAQRREDASCDRTQVLRIADLGQEERELVAAEPGDLRADAADDVVPPQRSEQPRRDLLQQRVSDAMAEGVVDALEMVEVEHHHTDVAAALACALDRVLELLLEVATIAELRQLIVVHEVADPLFVAVALGDVLEHALEDVRLAFVAANDLDLALEHPLGAARPDDAVIEAHRLPAVARSADGVEDDVPIVGMGALGEGLEALERAGRRRSRRRGLRTRRTPRCAGRAASCRAGRGVGHSRGAARCGAACRGGTARAGGSARGARARAR